MMGMVDELAIQNLSWTPRQVWLKIKNMLDLKSNGSWIGKNDCEVMNRVKHMRHVMVGKDAFRMIEQPHVGKIKDSDSWFLQFNMTAVNPDANELERLTGFGNPELFYLFKGNTHIHADGTFFCVPHPFKQVVVIMVYDEQTELHVPVLHALATGEQHAIVSF